MTRRNWIFVTIAVIAIVGVGVVASQFSSSQPDGLEYVAEEQGFADTADDHSLRGSPLADYGENLDTSGGVATAIAGIVGIAVTAAVGFGLFWLVRSGRNDVSSAS